MQKDRRKIEEKGETRKRERRFRKEGNREVLS